MRKTSILMWVLGGFVLLIVTAEVLILVANARTRYQAEALVRDLRTIKLGESTADDVLRIVRHYPTAPGRSSSSDCAAADESHSIRIANDIINRVGFAIPALRVVGARPASVVAVILLQKGRVCYVFYSFAVAHWSKIDELRAEATEGLFNCDKAKHTPSESCYDVGEGIIRNHIEKLDVRLANFANAAERQHAFDFDLSCLTSILGCQKLCVMNPSRWRDYLARARREGWILPADVNDPHCRAIQD